MSTYKKIALTIIISMTSISALADSSFETDIYSRVSTGVKQKLKSCQDISVDNASYIDCYDTAIKDEDVYLSFLRAHIQNNIINNKSTLIEFDKDVKCSKSMEEKISNNTGSVWPGIALNFCLISKDNAFRKWSFFYDSLKSSEQYQKNMRGMFDEQ